MNEWKWKVPLAFLSPGHVRVQGSWWQASPSAPWRLPKRRWLWPNRKSRKARGEKSATPRFSGAGVFFARFVFLPASWSRLFLLFFFRASFSGLSGNPDGAEGRGSAETERRVMREKSVCFSAVLSRGRMPAGFPLRPELIWSGQTTGSNAALLMRAPVTFPHFLSS